ncbi:hypothetical protein OROMI_030880 [Orobanche minor]
MKNSTVLSSVLFDSFAGSDHSLSSWQQPPKYCKDTFPRTGGVCGTSGKQDCVKRAMGRYSGLECIIVEIPSHLKARHPYLV